MSYVRITKVEEFKPPAPSELPVNIGYWVEGKLIYDVEVGTPVVMLREVRNGIRVPGLFKTSPVTSAVWTDDVLVQFSTENSVYTVEPAESAKPV